MLNNTIIEASAGTGKTHQLTSRILNLLASGEDIQNILATTFTRKAAGEIRARVFFRLAHAAISKNNSKQLSSEIESQVEDFSDLLMKVIASQHKLKISTIDGFFVQVATLFSAELGLPFQWEIVDTARENQIRVDAVGRTIEKIKNDKQESERTAFLHMLNTGKAARSVHGQLERLTKNLDHFYYDTKEADWSIEENKKTLSPTKLKERLKTLSDLEVPKKKDNTPNSNWVKVLAKLVKSIDDDNWELVLENGLLKKISAKESKYYTKEIPAAFIKCLLPIIEHAEAKIVEEHKAKALATRQLLEFYNQSLEQDRHDSGWMRFSDVTHFLEAHAESFLGHELYFRLDAKVKHLLLDEFQDTSISQWNILQPIVEEIVSQDTTERSFFCVGDAKQAIYGWRGGVSTIFSHLSESFPHVPVSPLHQSRRLRPAVTTLVNSVYESIGENSALEDYPKARDEWNSLFVEHTSFNYEKEGYCKISFAEDEEETSFTQQVSELVIDLYRKNPKLRIGILTRANNAVKDICDCLNSLAPEISPSQEVGAGLYQSEAVRIICSVLRFCEHPADTISRFHVENSCLSEHIYLNSQQILKQIDIKGFAHSIETWCGVFKGKASDQDLMRLEKLVELAYVFEKRPYMRFSEFILKVKNTKIDNLLSSNVRVMNIHQSKGLEFDVVILADLDRDFFGKNDEILTSRSHPLKKAEKATCAPKKITREGSSELQDLFHEAREKKVVEELCTLYVAITRAKYGVFGLIQNSSRSRIKHSSVITAALAKDKEEFKTAELVYEMGSFESLLDVQAEQAKGEDEFHFNIEKINRVFEAQD